MVSLVGSLTLVFQEAPYEGRILLQGMCSAGGNIQTWVGHEEHGSRFCICGWERPHPPSQEAPCEARAEYEVAEDSSQDPSWSVKNHKHL